MLAVNVLVERLALQQELEVPCWTLENRVSEAGMCQLDVQAGTRRERQSKTPMEELEARPFGHGRGIEIHLCTRSYNAYK